MREVAKLTNKSFREIGEALANDMLDNEDSLSEYDFKLGSNIAPTEALLRWRTYTLVQTQLPFKTPTPILLRLSRR